MLWPRQENTIQKIIIWPWGQRSRSHEGHYGMRHTALWSCTHIPNKYYSKNNYLTLRLKVKVPQRSLWYTTHHLMVMHPHTKYHWPISKDKNVMPRTRKYYLIFLFDLEVKGQGHTKVIMVRHTPPYAHAPTYRNHWPIWKDKKVMVRTSFAEKKQKRKKKSD
jgi:hypothetical protein